MPPNRGEKIPPDPGSTDCQASRRRVPEDVLGTIAGETADAGDLKVAGDASRDRHCRRPLLISYSSVSAVDALYQRMSLVPDWQSPHRLAFADQRYAKQLLLFV
jgi:hypothetical protein